MLNFDWVPQKPWVKHLANDVDYYQLFAQLRQLHTSSYLFESLALPRHQDRFYSMGFDPKFTLTATGSLLKLRGDSQAIADSTGVANTGSVDLHTTPEKNAYTVLRDASYMSGFGTSHQGGLVGYFCHEAINLIEPTLHLTEHQDFKLFQLGLYLDGLLFDSTTQELTYYSYEPPQIREEKFAFMQTQIDILNSKPKGYLIPHDLHKIKFLGYSQNEAEFITAVESTQHKIALGYSFQAEVGFKSLYNINGDKFAVYDRLRQVNPSPYMFYVQFADIELLGASPEILLSNQQGQLLTTPAAGTIHRGRTANEDALLARQLLNIFTRTPTFGH